MPESFRLGRTTSRECGVAGGSAGAVPEAAHQGHEEAGRPGLAQERVLEQLEGRGPLARVPHQHLLQEALKPGRDLRSRASGFVT